MRIKYKWHHHCERLIIGLILIFGVAYLWQDKTVLYDSISSVFHGYMWIKEGFNHISNYDGDWFIWSPFLLVVALLTLGMIAIPKPPYFLRVCVIMVMIAAHTAYIIFRTFNTLIFDDIGSGITTILLWIAESMIYLCSMSMYIQLLFTVDHKNKVACYEASVVSGEYQPSVDVFIPTYSEPIEMIRRTMIGCQAIEYTKKTVYVLDDGNRPEIRNLAKELECAYIARPKNIHAKAGNVNNALKQTDGELIAFFDADCVPLKNFLKRTIGFFQESDVGLVSSAQAFYNADMFKHNVISLMEQSTFSRYTQRGRDRFNAMMCFGTCYVLNRCAIEEICGIPVETLSEDWATSIKLQSAGYKTYMIDEVLGAGASAESMGEFIQQRIRWTQGTLQALFSSTNPLKIKGLNFIQRVIHSYGILHYLINPIYILIIVIPLLYFFFGYTPFYITRGQFWFIFMPFMAFNALAISWICREYTSKISSVVAESFMSIPLSIAAIKTLIRPFGWRFRVTKKGVYRAVTALNLILGVPILVLLFLTIFGIIYGYKARFWYGSEDLYFFLFLVSLVRIVFLWIGLYASHDFPQQRKSVRFQHCFDCLFSGDKRFGGKTLDISETGLLLECGENINISSGSNLGEISINDMGVENVPARLVRAYDDHRVAIAFKKMPMSDYRKLVEYLYCLPGRWDHSYDLDKKVLSSLKKAIIFDRIFERRLSLTGKVK